MNNLLNAGLYQILRKGISQGINKREKWYTKSYRIFTDHQVKNQADFYRMIAFAYSWMPTIPRVDTELAEKNLRMDLILQLQSGMLEKKDREELLKNVIPIINNSLVGASKTLHFIAPTQIPIIDSRVVKGWFAFFEKQASQFLSVFARSHKANYLQPTHLNEYLEYWELIEQWKNNCNNPKITLRSIEEAFFYWGASK